MSPLGPSSKRRPVSLSRIKAATQPSARLRSGVLRRLLEAQQRERLLVLSEVTRVKGLMPLLMKTRNGGRWTAADRIELQEQLRALRHLSPYLLILALPGSIFLLPLLAWWLDRRRMPRRNDREQSR